MYALEPPVLHVVRLDPDDRPLDYYHPATEPEFQGLVPQQALLQQFGLRSWKTLLEYRKVAMGYSESGELIPDLGIADYKASALERNPDFPQRMANNLLDRLDGLNPPAIYPDEPPFTLYEAWCLGRIRRLYQRLNRRSRVEQYVRLNQQLFTKEKYQWSTQQDTQSMTP